MENAGLIKTIHPQMFIQQVEHVNCKEIDQEQRSIKRIMDISITILVLPIAALLVAIACLLIKLSSKGEVFFIQKRVGLNGKIFTLYKIRTMQQKMVVQFTSEDYTVVNDQRITVFGRFLRKTKLDELPQLWNVMKGDMSLIGPRPERVEIVKRFEQLHPFYKSRHSIKPGLTGLAQVNMPTATPEENLLKLKYDLYYINHASIPLDILILLKTIGIIATMKSL